MTATTFEKAPEQAGGVETRGTALGRLVGGVVHAAEVVFAPYSAASLEGVENATPNRHHGEVNPVTMTLPDSWFPKSLRG